MASGRQQKTVVGNFAPVGKLHGFRRTVDRLRRNPEADVDFLLLIERFRLDVELRIRQRFGDHAGEGGPPVGQHLLARDERDFAGNSGLSGGKRGFERGNSAADNDDLHNTPRNRNLNLSGLLRSIFPVTKIALPGGNTNHFDRKYGVS